MGLLEQAQGEHVGLWLVGEPIDSGGFGHVFRARERHSPEVIRAIKIIPPVAGLPVMNDIASDIALEIQALEQLDHPNIIEFHGHGLIRSGTLAGAAYIVMELADVTLNRHVDTLDGAQVLVAVARFLKQACRGLRAMHDRRMVHRDIKPSNVLLCGDTAKLADFGLVRSLQSRSAYAITDGKFRGTIPYCAPEMLAKERYPPAADVFAMGVTMHVLATGRLPHGTSPEILAQFKAIIDHDLRIDEALPDPWRELIAACCHPDERQRPDALTLVARLAALELHSGAVVTERTDHTDGAQTELLTSRVDVILSLHVSGPEPARGNRAMWVGLLAAVAAVVAVAFAVVAVLSS